MRFVKQAIDIPIQNFDNAVSADRVRDRRHSELLPDTIRCIIAGPSNCGKTNLLVSLIESEHGLKFENIYIYSKTLGQPKYKYLQSVLDPIDGVGFHTFSASDQVIAPNEAAPNSIFVFDDVICDRNQENMKNFYCLGRHYGTDVFYLTQTFTKVSKHLIRDNCNFLILFRQDETNLRHVFNDFSIACDMKFDEFSKFCYDCWKDKYSFVVIDQESEPNHGRYRKGFNQFLQIYKSDVD